MIDSETNAKLGADTPRFIASETLIRDRKSLRLRSGLRAGQKQE
jgi:hypothetical protein